MEIWSRTAAFCGAAWFAPFGFADALRPPGRDYGFSPQEMMDNGLLFAGTVDSVKRQVQNMLDTTPVSWVFMWQYNGLLSQGQILRTIEDFSEKVLPDFGGLGNGV